MGLIRELVDEIIPLPKQKDHDFISKNEMACIYRISYAFINLFFQFIDCLAIPYFTLSLFAGLYNFGWIKWVLILLGVFSSDFNIIQSIYYSLVPTENYKNPFLGRILGETAIAILLSALFKIKIISLKK